MTTHRRRIGAAAVVLGALLLGAACGGSAGGEAGEVASLDEDAPATSAGATDDADAAPADREEAMLAYVECMREHGIDMPDPVVEGGPDGGGGVVIDVEGEVGDDDFEAAQAECGPIMEAAMGDIEIDPEQEAEMRQELLDFAQCMRDHGIDMPDPVFDGSGRVTLEMAPGERVDPAVEDEVAAASEACGRDGPGMIVGGPSDDEGEGG